MGDNDPSQAAAEVTHNRTLEKLARAGFVGSGILHLLIGYLAIRVALGRSTQPADQSGALAELAKKPGGAVALWFCCAAFLLFALWQVAAAIAGRSVDRPAESGRSKAISRIEAACLGGVYAVLAFSAFGFARGAGKRSSQESVGLSARLMENGLGRAVLIIAGIVIVAVGGYHVYKGVRREFLQDLKLSGSTSNAVRWLGIIGYIAKGLAIGGAGVLFIVATINARPERATGLDGALKTLGAQTYGTVLLIVAGLGIITYGLFSFAKARFEKM